MSATRDGGQLQIAFAVGGNRGPWALKGSDALPLLQWLIPTSGGGPAYEFARYHRAAELRWLDRALSTLRTVAVRMAYEEQHAEARLLRWASVGVDSEEWAIAYELEQLDPYDLALACVYGELDGDRQPTLPLGSVETDDPVDPDVLQEAVIVTGHQQGSAVRRQG